jgi:hypothetical protein
LNQYGSAKRDQYNVRGNLTINNPPRGSDKDRDGGDGPSSSNLKGGAAAGGGGFIVLLLIFGGMYLFNAQEPFPTTGDTPPAGSEGQVLMQVAGAG